MRTITIGITHDDGRSIETFSFSLPTGTAEALAAALGNSLSADVHVIELVDDTLPEPVYAPAPDGSPF
jgi:hypothetical protein